MMKQRGPLYLLVTDENCFEYQRHGQAFIFFNDADIFSKQSPSTSSSIMITSTGMCAYVTTCHKLPLLNGMIE